MQQVDSKTLRLEIERDRSAGATIGFVPTMGALHEGHLCLVRRARADNQRVAVSIFVNPLQFGPAEDLAAYPRDLQGDAQKLEQEGVDYLFAPPADEIYPRGAIETRVDPGSIGEVLEGRFRPGFFTGVATVCVKLFNLVQPDRAYFGQKDAQQLAVIRQVTADLDLPVEIVGCLTVREPGGLAMSSRNRYLSDRDRAAARVLSRALFAAERLALAGERNAAVLKRLVTDLVAAEPDVELQYAEVADPATFRPEEVVGDRAVIALAAFVGNARLIDNVELDLTDQEGTN